MKISVIVPTKRYGGLDILLSSLGKQTGVDKNDFELIIIDDFVDKDNDGIDRIDKDRKELCTEYARKFGVLNVIYLRSKGGYWRSNHPIANARNTGLIYAKGKLVVFVDDYTRLPFGFLQEHWKVFKGSKYTLIGGGLCEPLCDRLDTNNEIIRNGVVYKELPIFEDTRILDSRFKNGRKGKDMELEDCGGGWFYTFNASAPLEKIIDVNGFDEEFDLTREEDIDLGLRLEKVGCKFCYKFNWKCNVIHVDHRFVDIMMKKEGMVHNKYKDITYEMLRSRSGLSENGLDDVQLVLKEKYGTTYDGSWGLHEKRRNDGTYFGNVNVDNGLVTFDLREERRKVERE